VLATAAPASAATKLVVTGRGWGHGVGMSQWGAYGYARHGWRWERILAHYYPGTQLGDAPVSKVRVLLASARPHARIACAAAIRVGDATGQVYSLPPGSYIVGPALRLPVGHKRVRVGHGEGHRERFARARASRSSTRCGSTTTCAVSSRVRCLIAGESPPSLHRPSRPARTRSRR
jgi:hypothetical protein